MKTFKSYMKSYMISYMISYINLITKKNPHNQKKPLQPSQASLVINHTLKSYMKS